MEVGLADASVEVDAACLEEAAEAEAASVEFVTLNPSGYS